MTVIDQYWFQPRVPAMVARGCRSRASLAWEGLCYWGTELDRRKLLCEEPCVVRGADKGALRIIDKA